MDWVGPSIEVVKLVGGRFVRYLKYQIKYNDLLQEFEQSKQGLCNRKHDIASELRTQLESAPYHVVKAEVEDWLREVEEFIERQNVVDEVNSWGYLSCCCRAVILEERTQELKEIYDRGDKYTNECLVIEDHSRKLNYDVKNFKELKEKLQHKQGDIGSTLPSQLVYGKIEKEEVKHWLGKVEEMLKGVKDIEDKMGGSPQHSSDSLVMLLREKIQEMERMCDEGSQLPDCLVIDDPSASAVELPVPKLQGNEAVKAKILAYLKGEEVAKLGVWGMGGIGKTTIMKNIHNELQKQPKPKFKKIIWVTVSQNFQIYKLQEQIASSLKEELPKDQNIAMRAGQLFEMLREDKHKPFLLILDDVWKIFDLNEVGIPEPNVPNVTDGCKLVLTTRSQEFARSMDCRRGGIKRDLESTLKDIVDECDGLPLALSTVAGSLKGISDSRLWSVALNQLRDCKRNVAGPDNADAFQILKFSYDRLKDKQIEDCFLYCALYPEDYMILKEEIIEYWIDEGFIDEMDTRQAMKDWGYYILKKLEECSLLELIKEDEHEYVYGGDRVRMHDLIRDMALHITKTSPRFLVEAGKALKELPEKVNCAEGVQKVSLMCNCIEEIPSSMASSTCKGLTTLLLAQNDLSTISESIFEHMPELKILDLSFNEKLSSLPNSVSSLVKLTTLLLESTGLKSVPSLSGLGSLKKLNLRGTNIEEVPEGLGELKNLKCLYLCGSDHGDFVEIDEIADGVLSNLSKLQELIVNRSSIILKGDDVGRLNKLEVFYGRFPTVDDVRIFLKSQPNKLNSYVIIVGSNLDSFEEEEIYESPEGLSRYEKIMLFRETSIVGENTLCPSVQFLFICDCHNIRSLNDFSDIKDVTDLRRCVIWGCEGMEWILSSWINSSLVQTLEYLELWGLHKLDGLFEANVMATSSPPPGIFSSLKEVSIVECKKIKKLFPSWKLVECLKKLEVLCVDDCEEMEEIIASDPEEEGEEGGDIIKKLILPKLKKLSLEKLPALKSICSRRAVMVCHSLEEIGIRGCKGLRRMLLSLPLVEYAQSLERIKVSFCEEIEEIIASDPEEEEEGGDIIKKLILPKLKELELHFLPALKSICSRRAVMVCDSLESISIWDCKGLRRIPFRLPPRLSLKGLDDLEDWVFEVELITIKEVVSILEVGGISPKSREDYSQ
ncbi:hypothetical protein SLEP1_g43021 [Rubroshorea leprosula]|uniref:AAA+ ATPase domain-containing protein n=1 Tax=Rubroshorea leprosula TaxID=152421 RepID=A0AAV5LC35_9ROSI|nr:hypothetical protein SLEP1_g43021 [Rubroshorea leprosula]